MAKGMKSWTWWIIGAICWLIVGRQAQAAEAAPELNKAGNSKGKPVSEKPSLTEKVREKVNQLIKQYLTGDRKQRDSAFIALNGMKNEAGIVLRKKVSANNKAAAECAQKLRKAKNNTELQASLMKEYRKITAESRSLNGLSYRLFRPAVSALYGVRPRPVPKYGVRRK